MNIGDRLRGLRNTRGLTLNEVAEKADCSAILIRKIEAGYSPNVATLKMILEVYDTTLGEFFNAIPKTVRKEDREVFDRLQFILDEARLPNADEKQKSRAKSISENVEEFYNGAITHNRPPSKRAKRSQQKGKENPAISRKKHGKFMAIIENEPKAG